jgi:hypothetical protein
MRLPSKKARPLEKDIQRQCIDFLKLLGAVPVRVNSAAFKVGNRFIRANSEPGCSDVLVCLPGGAFLACEVKRPGEKPTAKQVSFLAAVTAAGGLALVVSSLSQLQQALRDEGYDVGL